jgi:2-oxo-4-hydroxy-4-carboxy-5-ureidoimidazoline decarboxylase
MNTILMGWNLKTEDLATADLLHCCASRRWAEQVVTMRPFADESSLYDAADRIWAQMKEPDWMEAFRAHPRIGERDAQHASEKSSAWSEQEQAASGEAQGAVQEELAAGNRKYEEAFGFTYIICATGKSAEEMLSILNSRLTGSRDSELKEAAEQQRLIMQIRLKKWLQP